MMRRLTDKKYLAELAETLEGNTRDARREGRIERLEAQAKKLETKRKTVLEMRSEGEYTKAEADEILVDVKARIAAVNTELAREREAMLPNASRSQLEKLFEPFKHWDLLEREDRRQLLTVTIPRIRVSGNSVVSFYSLLDDEETAVFTQVSGGNAKKATSRLPLA